MTYDAATPAGAATVGGSPAPRASGGLLRQVLEPLLTVLVFVGAGAAGGWWWEHRWHPTTGVVIDGTWYSGTRLEGDYVSSDFPGLRGYFDATASFLLIGLVAGLVLGVLAALLVRRSELVMLAAVVVGSVAACFIAYRLGVHLGPPDPAGLARSADDGTVLPTDLSLTGISPFVGWSLGGLVGVGSVFFLTTGVSESRRRELDDPRWLSRNQSG